jgi:ABC-type antimicrobial peptide transport system permease subunit
MLKLLAKSLHGHRIRTHLAIAGVATCTLLVIVIASAYRSVRTAMSDYAGQAAVDLWIAPQGADNMIRGSFISFIPLTEVRSLQTVPGVAAVDPILQAFLPVRSLRSNGPQKRLMLLTLGYRLPDGLGGPPSYVRGRAPHSHVEVALDKAAAHRLSIGTGDKIELNERQVIVTGLTTGTNILATQFVFADFDLVASGSNASGRASFALVKLAPGADRERTIQTIEKQFPDLRAYTREYFVESNEREVSAGFVPLLALVTVLGVGAAALLVGLLILSVVDERRGDIAVLIALGTGARAVGRGVLVQATALSLKGAFIGVALSYGLSMALDAELPTIPLRISVLDVVMIALLFIITGLVAAIAPVVQLNAIDPLEAFRS